MFILELLGLLVVCALLSAAFATLGSPFSTDGLKRWVTALVVVAVLLGGGLQAVSSAVVASPPFVDSAHDASTFDVIVYLTLVAVGYVSWQGRDDRSREPKLRARRRALPPAPNTHDDGDNDAP
ncbi:MAG: hypothetical protein ACHREM_11040 [Polyangiales bacterium]